MFFLWFNSVHVRNNLIRLYPKIMGEAPAPGAPSHPITATFLSILRLLKFSAQVLNNAIVQLVMKL